MSTRVNFPIYYKNQRKTSVNEHLSLHTLDYLILMFHFTDLTLTLSGLPSQKKNLKTPLSDIEILRFFQGKTAIPRQD